MIETINKDEFYVKIEGENPSDLLQRMNGMAAKFREGYRLKMISCGPGLKGMMRFQKEGLEAA